jgi:hypothetical protein
LAPLHERHCSRCPVCGQGLHVEADRAEMMLDHKGEAAGVRLHTAQSSGDIEVSCALKFDLQNYR